MKQRTEDRGQGTVRQMPVRHRTPIDIARAEYEKRRTADRPTFDEVMAQTLFCGGHILESATCFLMGYPLTDGVRHAWFCRCAVGDLREMIALMPSWKPFICFQRRDTERLRWYRTARLLALIGRAQRSARPARTRFLSSTIKPGKLTASPTTKEGHVMEQFVPAF